MCGIAGWLGDLTNGRDIAPRMAHRLRHRGPDAQAIRSWQAATLIHTRLSILDLSEAGAQPMANEDGRIWTIFNGEIYNHREIRRNLESLGHVFRGHSDTEILPHLYEEDAEAMLRKLRGMFAFAIYDAGSQTMILARDRFGIKPLFYSLTGDRLVFASEINTLMEVPDIDTQPDRQAIFDFAALFYIPAPQTFYQGIRALEPGEVLIARFDGNRVSSRIQKYHQWAIAPDAGMTLSQAADRADALLDIAVRQQLESDVPLGALLSGGIDSSLVSVAAQAALNGGLKTFNVSFSDTEYDETWAALAVAEHSSSQHETLVMDSIQGTWDHVTNLLLHAGQPFADASLFAVNAVCNLMRKHVTVALSGDGGDEGFGGYDLYWQIAKIDQWQELLPTWGWRMAATCLTPLGQLRIVPKRLPLRIRDFAGADNTAIVQSMYCWLREEEHSSLCQDTNALPVRRLFESQWENHQSADTSRLERLSALATEANVRLMLPNDFLFKVDIASMKESLEIRVPMLDEDLFQFGLTLPHSLKVHERTCKRVLRKVAERKLPLQVANKPKKGFNIPVDRWVDTNFKDRLKETLLGGSSRLCEFFKPQVYRPMIEAFCDSRPCPGISRDSLYQRAIMLLSIELALGKR
jgi:asparagine synthase (glutamine-hydrolysing)